jgi:isopentenyl diphosphate isomerase/L-lactate dehydrogenase-like FMN-dependent dehydrogenase
MNKSALPWDPLELAAEARRNLTAGTATYYETTAVFPPTNDNEVAWSQWRFVPRVARDVSSVSTEIELFGKRTCAPILLAPCAFTGRAHTAGELAVARAAAETGTTYAMSQTSSKPPSDVAKTAPGMCWLQIYVPDDEDELLSTLSDAAAAGFVAVVVTVDAPVGSMRYHGYVPDRVFVDPMQRARPSASPLNPAVTWKTIERIVEWSSLPVLVKGVLRPDDARAAVLHGAAGVIVSNHGARQLDGVVPTAAVLEKIAAVADPAPVLVDGGIRTGRDVLRALCLGARAVLIGRPYLWALAISGAGGVQELLLRMRLELENALALTGCTGPADAARDLLVRWSAE